MGEDLIYQYKKLLPHFLIILFGWLLGFMAISFIFSDWIGTFESWMFLFGSFAVMFTLLLLEYKLSKRFVRGKIASLEISDLTKSIYWLSIINSGNANFSLGGFYYWTSVGNVARTIGGRFSKEWQKITREHGMLKSRKWYIYIIVLFLCLPFMLAIQFVDPPFTETMLSFGVIIVVIASMAVQTSRYLRTLKKIAQDPEIRKITKYLLNVLIHLVTSESTKPIRVIVADGVYSNVEPVDSLLGLLVIEMPKRSPKQPFTTQKTSFLSRRTTSIAIYLTPVILIGLSFIIPSLQRFMEKGSLFSFLLILMGVGMLGIFEFFLYLFTPVFRGMLSGSLSTPDFASVVKRFPKGMLKDYSETLVFKSKIEHVKKIYEQNSLKLDVMPESIQMWIHDDLKSPSNQRYFALSGNSVELTIKGRELAEVLMEKLGDYETHKKLLDLLNS